MTSGTIVRVFNVDNNQNPILYEFRRGRYYANIHSLTFSSSSAHIVVSSNRETVHVFKLDENNKFNYQDRTRTTETTSGSSQVQIY